MRRTWGKRGVLPAIQVGGSGGVEAHAGDVPVGVADPGQLHDQLPTVSIGDEERVGDVAGEGQARIGVAPGPGDPGNVEYKRKRVGGICCGQHGQGPAAQVVGKEGGGSVVDEDGGKELAAVSGGAGWKGKRGKRAGITVEIPLRRSRPAREVTRVGHPCNRPSRLREGEFGGGGADGCGHGRC